MFLMRARFPLGFVLALDLNLVLAWRAEAQAAPPAQLPPGATACAFDALANVSGDPGLVVRAAPSAAAPVVANLPVIARFHVIGFKDGWFMIEGARSREDNGPPLYAGQGWAPAEGVTTNLFRDTLKKAPDSASPDVVYLRGADTDGIAFEPYGIVVDVRILACKGPWLQVEFGLPGARTVFGKPISPDGLVRGWTDRSCAEKEPCRGGEFDYPWSPLPSGVTECDFKALSRDPDPAGLNVREAPDKNAPIVGRVLPPMKIQGEKVLADVHVIGYAKGWFLVELGPYAVEDMPHDAPQPYTGRGWVAASMLTTELLRNQLKQAPSQKAADVADLMVMKGGVEVSDPQSVKIRRILACSGDWVHVEIAVTPGMKALASGDAPPGAARGWANGTCANQLTTCDFDQNRPWSPDAPLPPE